jgi:diphosphomevalonate decarboxylase
MTSSPPIVYTVPETLEIMKQVRQLHKDGIEVYFTQDAGPNLSLLFLKRDEIKLQNEFKSMVVVKPFITEL